MSRPPTSRCGASVLAAALAVGVLAWPAAGHATGHAGPTATAASDACWFGASTALTMVAPSLVDGSALSAPLFATEAALLASPVVQFAAAAGVAALSFCYAGQAVAPLYLHLTQDAPPAR